MAAPQYTAFEETRTAQFDPLCGWTFAYNINPGLVTTTQENGGTVTHNESFAVLQTGTDPAGKAKIETFKTSRYIPGIGGLARFTYVFDPPAEDNFHVIGLGDETDGWFFGYNGLDFGVLRINNGVHYWTYKPQWNRDTRCDFNPQQGNVYQIAYQWLGFGDQTFSIKKPNGGLDVVHVIEYANSNTDTSIENPNLPLTAWVENKGNTTNISGRTPSAIAGLDGDSTNEAISLVLADDIQKTINGLNQPIISFYNPPTYEGKNNRLFVEALRLTLASEGAKPMIFRVYANAVPLDGTFTPIQSALGPIEVNKTFTTYAGGVLIGSFSLGKSATLQVPLADSKFRGYPGQYITIVGSTNGVAMDIATSVAFRQYL